MKKFLLVAALGGGLLAGSHVTAQEKCGLDITTREAIKQNPHLAEVIQQHSIESKQRAEEWEQSMANAAMKGTGITSIPVVFHVILTQAQLNSIGGEAGVLDRVNSQIIVLNKDYNARNSDVGNVPDGFKPDVGNAEMASWLAHTDPNGAATNGIEIRVADAGTQGFSQGSNGIKRTSLGGLDPWDNQKYLNIWIINITDNSLLGFAYSPNYAATVVFDPSKAGVVLAYGAFGVKPLSTNEYWHGSATKGRTLTHELGHYFNLWHTWGKGQVGSGTCSDEDEVDDTPKQYDATQSCKLFPYKDVCSPSGNGIMYMNYMDYSGDGCTKMFSKGQVARMRAEIAPGGDSYGLTQHPELFDYPTGTPTIEKTGHFNIFPNPSNGLVNISFDNVKTLKSLTVINSVGQVVKKINVENGSQTYFSFDLSGYNKGVYMVQAQFEQGQVLRKVVIQ